MQNRERSLQIEKWIRPSRLVPILTIAGAGIAIILDILNVVDLRVADEIIIALLALVAIDALTERLYVLEKIESKLGSLSTDQTLKKRTEILTPVVHAKWASEICLLAVHGASVITPFFGFYKSKIENGCKFRVVLLDPTCSSLDTWNLLTKGSHTKHLIESSLDTLGELMKLPKTKGKCEVRLSNVFLPYSLFAVDLFTAAGSMIVEYNSYKLSIDDRPHIRLTAMDNQYWFNHFKQQLEQAWADSIVWVP